MLEMKLKKRRPWSAHEHFELILGVPPDLTSDPSRTNIFGSFIFLLHFCAQNVHILQFSRNSELGKTAPKQGGDFFAVVWQAEKPNLALSDRSEKHPFYDPPDLRHKCAPKLDLNKYPIRDAYSQRGSNYGNYLVRISIFNSLAPIFRNVNFDKIQYCVTEFKNKINSFHKTSMISHFWANFHKFSKIFTKKNISHTKKIKFQ